MCIAFCNKSGVGSGEGAAPPPQNINIKYIMFINHSMGNQLATTAWLMLHPVISLNGELNECVLIALIIKIKGVIEINGVVKA